MEAGVEAGVATVEETDASAGVAVPAGVIVPSCALGWVASAYSTVKNRARTRADRSPRGDRPAAACSVAAAAAAAGAGAAGLAAPLGTADGEPAGVPCGSAA
ncbi:MAG: hypothetical protein IPM90_10685 [Austwickia sp.]|nr:hypothetical protein [Austwickia sp.]